MKKYSVSKNSGIELNLSTMDVNYNLFGMISALLTLFWAFFMAPDGLSADELTYLGLQKYFLIVLCIVVHQKIVLRMKFPYKVKIEDDGMIVKFKFGRSEKINVDQFLIDESINQYVLDKLRFKTTNPVKLLTEFNGREVLLILEEEETHKLRE